MPRSEDRPILVTGSSGFIGRWLVSNLKNRGAVVIEVPHRWVSADELRRKLEAAEPSHCVHLGWYADPRDYLVNADENLASLRQSIELARILAECGCRHLLVAGSSAEYAPRTGPLSESCEVRPWSAYGAAKAALRVLLDSSMLPADLVVGWARIFNLTGPGESSLRAVAQVAQAALVGREIELTDGSQVRDFLDVRDVADALAHLSITRMEGAVNICSGRPVTLRALFTQIAEAASAPAVLGWGRKQRSATDPDSVVGDSRRLAETGWAPAYATEETVADVLNYWRASLRAATGPQD